MLNGMFCTVLLSIVHVYQLNKHVHVYIKIVLNFQVSQLENLNSRVSIVESSLSLQSSQVGNIVTQLDSFTGTLTALQTNVQESVNELTLSLSSKV